MQRCVLRHVQLAFERIIRRCMQVAFLKDGGGLLDHFIAFVSGSLYSLGISLPSGSSTKNDERQAASQEGLVRERNLAVLVAARACLRRGEEN